MKIKYYKPLNKGSLLAVFDLQVPKWGDLVIRGMKAFQSNGRRWISFPSDKVEENGETKYFPKLYFEDKNMMGSFSQKVWEAIEEYAKQHAVEETQKACDEEVPF